MGSNGSSPVKMPFDRLTEGLSGLEKAIHLIRTRAERAEQLQEETLTAVREALPRQQRDIQQGLRHLHTVIVGAAVGLAGLGVVLAGVMLWSLPARQTTPNYSAVFLGVDGVLSQEWGKLPKGVQEQLSTA